LGALAALDAMDMGGGELYCSNGVVLCCMFCCLSDWVLLI
jgi:hypothetical protein